MQVFITIGQSRRINFQKVTGGCGGKEKEPLKVLAEVAH